MNDLKEIKTSLDATTKEVRRIRNSWHKSLRDNYVTKISNGLYLFENGDTKRLIERNDRRRAWDIYYTDGSTEPNPDYYTYDEETLRYAIIECYRESIIRY